MYIKYNKTYIFFLDLQFILSREKTIVLHVRSSEMPGACNPSVGLKQQLFKTISSY